MTSQPIDAKYDNSEYDNSESVVLSLESLNAQYTNILIEYRQAVTNYVTFLNDETNSSSTVQIMTDVSNAIYLGDSTIGQNNSSTLQECSASCSKTSGCSGATYTQNANGQPMCWLRGGESNITSGSESDHAIIPESKQLLMTVQTLNQQLIGINTKIQAISKSGETDYDTQSTERKQNTATLVKQYNILNEERERIEHAINDSQTIDQQQITSGLLANKNYISFMLLLLLVIIIMFVLYNYAPQSTQQQYSSAMMYGGKKVCSSKYFIYGIIIIIFFALVFMYNLNLKTNT